MDVFSTYLNNIFAAYEKTEQALRLKENLLLAMEEKYRDLMLNGLSHDAAVGKVMSEFGTIDELSDKLEPKTHTPQESFSTRDEEMIEEYQLFMKDYSMKFAATIALLALPLILVIVVSQWSGPLAAVAFLITGAIALFFFLSLINQKEYYLEYFKSRELYQFLDPDEVDDILTNKIKKENPRPNQGRYIWSKIRGNIWLFATAIYLVAGTFFDMWGTAWVVYPIATALLAID